MAAPAPPHENGQQNEEALARRLAETEVRLAASMVEVDTLRAQLQAGAAPPPPPPPPLPRRRNVTIQDLNPPKSSPFRKYLFLNDSILASPPAFSKLTFNAPERLGAVVKADRPWESTYIYSGSNVLQINGVIHLYYQCQADIPPGLADTPPGPLCMLCLATSDDGVTFTKVQLYQLPLSYIFELPERARGTVVTRRLNLRTQPSLGIATFNHSTANNIVLPTGVANGFPSWGTAGPVSGVFFDAGPGIPAGELFKAIWMPASETAPGVTWVSPDGIKFQIQPGPGLHLAGGNIWNSGGMLWDEDAAVACGVPDADVNRSGGRWLSYGRSDNPANTWLPGKPKVCGDLAAMRGVTLVQSVDLKSLECLWQTPQGVAPQGKFAAGLVRGAWDATDPNPQGNGGPLDW